MGEGAHMRFTVLGCGSSPGTPRANGDWGACKPDNPKNRRLRASLLVQRFDQDGNSTNIVIDTGPDFRAQMLAANVQRIDGVVYTHPHADHIHGIDDLRTFALVQRQLIDVWADETTMERLEAAFGYCFHTPPGSSYPPVLTAHEIEPSEEFTAVGPAGPITFAPLLQTHGSIHSLGFRIGNFAYCTDVSAFPHNTMEQLRNLDVLILDALQYRGHASHFSLEEALAVIEQIKPKRAFLTHMHIPLDYDTVMAETPTHVEPAYDGLEIVL